MALRVRSEFHLVDDILRDHASALGNDITGYRNHVYRVLNYTAALREDQDVPESVQIAAAFHDIGIWTDRTFDYLEPSTARCTSYLVHSGRGHLQYEAAVVIGQHHKLSSCKHAFHAQAEPFRRADLVDVSWGLVRYGIPRAFLRKVKVEFPDAGFHWRLATLAGRQLLLTPARPLPMLRL